MTQMVDQEGAIYVPVQPQPHPPPPAPTARPAGSTSGTARRRVARRRPVPIGTVAIGGTGVVTLAVVSAAVMLPPVAAVAAAGAAVVVPLSVAIRRVRRTRRGSGSHPRRTRSGLFNGSGRTGRLFGGGRGGGLGKLGGRGSGAGGGSGRAGKGLGLGKPGGLGKMGKLGKLGKGTSTAGHASGGLPGTGGKHRGKGLGLGKLGGRGAGTSGGRAGKTSTGSGAGRTGKGLGLGKLTGRGRGTSGGPRSGGRLGLGARGTGSRSPSTRTGRALRKAGKGLGTALAVPAAGTAWLGKKAGKGAYVAGKAAGKGAYRAGRAGVRGAANTGRATAAGYRAGGRPRDAARAAWRRSGQGRPRTFRSRLGRLLVGALGACGALAGRGAVNTAKKVWAAYRPQQAKPQVATQPTTFGPSTTAPPERPAPAPRRRPTAAPANPAPALAGSTPGGTSVSQWFPPYNAALDFFAACNRYTPGSDSGALFRLQAALPFMAESAWFEANAWKKVADRVAVDLGGGLKPEMAQTFADIYRLKAKAAELAADLPAAFLKIHADDVRRAGTRGAHTANVPVGGRI